MYLDNFKHVYFYKNEFAEMHHIVLKRYPGIKCSKNLFPLVDTKNEIMKDDRIIFLEQILEKEYDDYCIFPKDNIPCGGYLKLEEIDGIYICKKF